MPPKKSTPKTAASATEDGNGKFLWTVENERKLLILTQGRYLTGEDYERLTTVFPGTTKKAITVRVSKLRVEQRDLYKELGWELPEGGAKRKASGAGEESPAKKARSPTKKGKKSDEEKVVEEEDRAGEEVGVDVKQEVIEEDVDEEVVV
ncbi:hypothetical protein DE146DRAFT_182442 [Phaeosphaeria sp. MPI-PUGE-AT-0046c]|nr:hypothetical protein DE146DRAFT_182442 [Phaeosphaeria sp. MPI-PUGE-AT-0046c]